MSNRVEDLERQVAELQAAVNGLTEELVEMKERVRQLEDERSVGVEADATAGSAETTDSTETTPDAASEESDADEAATESVSGGERTTHSDDHVDVFESVEESSDGEEATGEGDGDDVLVPEQSATTPDAEASTDEADEDESESSDSDDIIVA